MNIAAKRFGSRASRWVGWGLAISGLLMLMTVAVGAFGTLSLYNSEADVQHSNEMYVRLGRLLALARDAETGQRGFVITGRDEYLEPYLDAVPQIARQFDRLEPLLKGDPAQQRRLARLHGLLDEKHRELQRVIDVRRARGFAAAQAIVMTDTGKAFMDSARATVAEMENQVAKQLAARQASARRIRNLAVLIGVASGLLTLFVYASFAYWSRRLLHGEAEAARSLFEQKALLEVTLAERERAEQQLRQRTEELARSNRDLEQFAYVASHDLQEPLRAVAGPLQLLQRRYEGQLDARADEFIGHAVDGATRMQALIDDLLTYSRVGRLEDPKQPVSAEQSLQGALKNLAVVIEETGAEITHDALPVVQAISTQLTLLFQNLIGNAIKFRHKERAPQIRIGAEAAGGHWRFSVTDNGIGIADQYFDRIFVIFQRLHTRREYPGTGLGLALCKRIVEHHGGKIWVESTPEEGTTFFFTMPRATERGPTLTQRDSE